MKASHGAFVAALFLLLQLITLSNSLPLSTKGRWIVDEKGNRVKLACANWPSHVEPMIADGLNKQPLDHIVWQVAANGFNCVRFTYATYMFTRSNYSSLTVTQSLARFNLTKAKAGIAKNNPQFLNMTVVDVHKAVVDELSKNGIMVVLDNHVSLPTWCCSGTDGNGFFGDEHFDPEEWMDGLRLAATRYHNNRWVVGMSLRNEPRGARQNVSDWYYYMMQGASVVHSRNPHALIFISGLSTATDLTFLHNLPIMYNYDNKLAFEMHWYSFGIPLERWVNQTNALCASQMRQLVYNGFFLTTRDDPYPIFLSEFGIDQRVGAPDISISDKMYINCVLALVAEYDLDWALWAFQGDYIYREGSDHMVEYYGVMNANWDAPQNIPFLERLQYLRQINRHAVDDSTTDQYVVFHPQSGQCLQFAEEDNNVVLGNCQSATRWKQHSNDGGPIMLANNEQCLSVMGGGAAVNVSSDCSSERSTWKKASSAELQLSAKNVNGESLCLERNDSDAVLVTQKCRCVDDNLQDVAPCDDNVHVQWFKFAPVN